MKAMPYTTGKTEFFERLREAITGEAGVDLPRGAIADLAKQFGVSKPTASAWVNGGHMPDPEKVKLMAMRYGVAYAWLYFGEGSKGARVSDLRPIVAWEGHDELDETYVVVPRLELRFSAGNGGPTVHADSEKVRVFGKSCC